MATATASSAGTAQDNSSNLDLYADFVLSVTFGSAPTAGDTCDLYLLPSVDGGTNYSDAAVAATPPKELFAGSFYLRAVTTAQVVVLANVQIPEKWKACLVNNSGQSFPASGSTLKYQSWHLQSV